MVDTVSSWIDLGDRLGSWTDLAALVEKYRANNWIFRGVDDASHDLVPGIGRRGARKDLDTGADLPYDEAEELSMLDRFQREVSAHTNSIVPGSDPHRLHACALAQHHGLRTRLLDWSESPLIAAYFAVEHAGLVNGRKTDAALYGAPCPERMEAARVRWPNGDDVCAFFPHHVTPRITVQRALFTVHPNPSTAWRPNGLVRWIIPADLCLPIKLALNRAGINRASLFPDSDGIAAHINWLHKWGLQ